MSQYADPPRDVTSTATSQLNSSRSAMWCLCIKKINYKYFCPTYEYL